MVGWKVTWFCTMSLRLIPLIMKLTVSSRAPAVLKANEPWPLGGALNAERGVFHRDGGAIDGRAILVGDCAFNAGGVLRESSCGRKQHREQQREKSLPEHLCLLKVQTTVEQV